MAISLSEESDKPGRLITVHFNLFILNTGYNSENPDEMPQDAVFMLPVTGEMAHFAPLGLTSDQK